VRAKHQKSEKNVNRPILVLSFGPFAGSNVNGSTTVAEELARRYPGKIDHRVLPVTWAAVKGAASALDEHDFAVGFGEGFPHVVAVERCAFNWPREKDNEGQLPPSTLLENGPPFLEADISALAWDDHRRDAVPAELIARMGYEREHPGIISGSFAGYGQYNALLYYLLQARRGGKGQGCGFIHLPPQEGWQRRTGRSSGEYMVAFTDAVTLVFERNKWPM
jgi:pyrrolidone-carboxylate peptidase